MFALGAPPQPMMPLIHTAVKQLKVMRFILFRDSKVVIVSDSSKLLATNEKGKPVVEG